MIRKAIIIFGNIASGKTTLGKLIAEKHPEFQRVCMDEIRLQIAPKGEAFTHKMEAEAQQIALDLIALHSNIIFETTGASDFSKKAVQAIESGFDEVNKFGIWVEHEILSHRLRRRQAMNQDFQHPRPNNLEGYQAEIQSVFRMMPSDWTKINGQASPQKLYVRHFAPLFQ